MEFSFAQQGPQSEDSLASERLRKAIERNRAKQSAREARFSAPPPPRPAARASSVLPSSSPTASRRSVAKVDDVGFTRELIPAAAKAPAPVSYGTTTAKRKVAAKKRVSKKASAEKTYLDYFVHGCWVFAAILLLRLIFSSGGVVDFYRSKSLLSEKQYDLELIQKENVALNEEIEKINSSPSHQKKIVRDHLGYIARDEFLILFQRENTL